MVNGHFGIKQFRKRKCITERVFHNMITNVGLRYLLSTGFTGVNPSAAWYIGLISGPEPSFSLAQTPKIFYTKEIDEMFYHPGWLEFIGLQNIERPEWKVVLDDHLALPQLFSFSQSNFIISVPSGVGITYSVAGAFITDNNKVDNEEGILWSAGLLNPLIPVKTDDVLAVSYRVSFE